MDQSEASIEVNRSVRGQSLPGAFHQVGEVPDDQDPVLTAADDLIPLHSGAQHLQDEKGRDQSALFPLLW